MLLGSRRIPKDVNRACMKLLSAMDVHPVTPSSPHERLFEGCGEMKSGVIGPLPQRCGE